jgi:hypothetical protein
MLNWARLVLPTFRVRVLELRVTLVTSTSASMSSSEHEIKSVVVNSTSSPPQKSVSFFIISLLKKV